MPSLRQTGRSRLQRAIARVLIAALFVALLPLHADASVASKPATSQQELPDLKILPPWSASSENLVCLLVAVANPSALTKSAFGELLAHTGSDPQPYAFTGEPRDPNSGWQYHRARWMDPRTGRFAGMDPFGGADTEPRALHKYMYAAADPASLADPTGLFDERRSRKRPALR